MPIAIVAIAVIWSSRLVKLRAVRKFSWRMLNVITITINPTMIGSEPSSPDFTPCHQRRA